MTPYLIVSAGARSWVLGDTHMVLVSALGDVQVIPGLPDMPIVGISVFEVTDPVTISLSDTRLEGASDIEPSVTLEATLVLVGELGWDERDIVCRFFATGWTVAPIDLVSASLSSGELAEDLGTVPSPEMAMSEATWPSGPEKQMARTYPIPFGTPGQYQDDAGVLQSVPGSPAIPYDTGLSGGLIVAAGGVYALQCTLELPDETTSGEVLSRGSDSLAQTFSQVLVGGALSVSDDTDYYIHWDSGPAIIGDSRAASTFNVVDLILYLLRRSSLEVDRSAWLATLDLFSDWEVSGCIEKVVQPWTYLCDAVFPLLPISILPGPRGFRPVPFRWDWRSGEERGHLTVRAGELFECSDKEIIGDLTPNFSVSWAFNTRTGQYGMNTMLSGDPALRGTTGGLTSAHTIAAFTRWYSALPEYQRDARVLLSTPTKDIESDILFDRGTVQRVLLWQSAAYALPSERRTYPASASVLDLDLGDPVLLTDEEAGLSRAPAIVERLPLARRGASTEITLRVLPSPLLSSYL